MSFIRKIYHNLNERSFLLRGMKPWTRGYGEYKSRNIRETLRSGTFDSSRLPAGYGFRLDERIVEYPWLFSRLPDRSGKLLDAGSILNFDYILEQASLANKKLYISTLAPEHHCYWQKGISYIYEDLRASCLKDNYFDWIASLSTIEHIGLDNTMLYTDEAAMNENEGASCYAAIKEYYRMLKPGGVLYLSFPYGKHVSRGWFQVFDADMLDKVIGEFGPAAVKEFHYRYESDGWCVSSREASKDATYFDVHTEKNYGPDFAAASRAIVCLELVK